MATQYANSQIVTNGLVLALDAADRNSYVSGSTTWNDLSGNGLNGKLSGSVFPTFTISSGGSFYFSNNTPQQQINFGSSSILAPGPNISAFMWVNPIATPTFNQVWAQFGVPSGSLSGTNFAQASGWRIALTTTNLLRIQLFSGSNNSGIISMVAGNPTAGSWNYAGFTLSGSQAYSYLNGKNVASANSSPSVPIIVNSGSLAIGYDNFPFYTSGSIANFQFYNRALSQAEVLQNYNAQKSRFGLT
jgi:hypothetical protein